MRTHLCGQVTKSDIDRAITLNGWVLTRRDHGGVIFIDLRDRSGKVQVVADPDYPVPFEVAEAVRNEYVLKCRDGFVGVRKGLTTPSCPRVRWKCWRNPYRCWRHQKLCRFRWMRRKSVRQFV